MVLERMERQRRLVMLNRGLDETTVNLMQDAATEALKRKNYKGVQRRFLQWCMDNDVDFFTPNPASVLNFLSWGHRTLGWKATTVDNYRAHIIHLYPGSTIFTNDPDFQRFTKILKANEHDTSTSLDLDLDLSPIITYLQGLPPNDTMAPIDLTQKMCWLLGMCGFLRPSDIARIDVDKTQASDTQVNLVIVRPKETTQGIHKNKRVVLQAHPSVPALCPVAAFHAYKQRLVGCAIAHPHDTNPALLYNPLVRTVNDPDKPIGADRIRNHIKAVMSHLQLPSGSKLPKARAAGSTRAAKRGTSLDDIITQGNWHSKRMFTRFYRLSRSTASNFTEIVLG